MNITCSALPEHLLESELFGHERGAFTDARMQKRGLLESADGGTVFLDEIAEMVPGLQAKLLRFLEEKSFKRVGGSGDIRVDVRVVAATNRNLEEEVAKGGFRGDLYYRLNVLPIRLPALRDQAEDVPALADFFIDTFNTEFKKRIAGLSPAASVLLKGYGWPGNVRELRNVVERAMLLRGGGPARGGGFRRPEGGPGSGDLVRPAGRRRQPRGSRAQPRRPGAEASGRQPDEGGGAARPEPRPDPLSDREIRPHRPFDRLRAGHALSAFQTITPCLNRAALSPMPRRSTGIRGGSARQRWR